MDIIRLIKALNRPDPIKCKHGSMLIIKDSDGFVTVRRCKLCGKDCRNVT